MGSPRRLAFLFALVILAVAQPAMAQDLDEAGAIGDEFTITLTNGDTLTGFLLDNTGTDIVLDHPLLGQVVISRTLIDLQDVDVAAPAPEPIEVISPWSGRADLAVEGSSGNTRERKSYITVNLRHELERTIDSLYFTSAHERNWQNDAPNSASGTTTKDEQYLRLRREWKFEESNWLPFAQIGSQWDSFKDYDYRINAAAGTGYKIIEEDDTRLIGRLGLGTNRKVGADPVAPNFEDEDDWVLEALAGVDVSMDFSATQHFVLESTIFPALTNDAGDYRTFTVGEWRLDLSETSPWYIKFGMDHEYDSSPVQGDKRDDFNYYGGLGVQF